MSVYFKFSVGRPGTSADNMRYITRSSATEENERSIITQNYPEYAEEGESYKERMQNIAEYARQKEQDEFEKPKRGKGETRTHYRAIASFEEKVDTEKAREMAREYMEKEFPKSRCVAVVHQDTNHTHIHMHIQARDTEEKKLHMHKNEYQKLDEKWGRLYGREFGEEKIKQHQQKKVETKEYKVAKANGKNIKAPERINYKSPEIFKNREDRNYGRYELDKTATRGTNRSSLNGTTERAENEGSSRSGEQEISRFVERSKRIIEQGNRTEQAARGALSESQGLRDKSKERNHLERDLLKRLR